MAVRRDEEGPLEAEQELAFADVGDRLPWLESDDEEDQPRVETGRIVAFAAVALMALVLLLGALLWFTRDGVDEELAADGGTIEAPEGPYKVRPDDPGGREVAGTGDTSFEVAEGRQVEGRIADTGGPRPQIDLGPAPRPSDAAEPAAPAAAVVGVQVGAYSSRAAAEAGWSQLSARLEPLQGRNHRVVEGTADSGSVFRLQALAGSAAEADALCRSIKAAGGDCQVKR